LSEFQEEVKGYIPPHDIDELTNRWIKRARESQFAHYELGDRLAFRHRLIGVPAILISTTVSLAVFGTLQKMGGSEWLKYLAIVFSLLAAVLSGIQTFMKYAERGEAHRAVAAGYGAIRRRLELLNATKPIDPKKLEKIEAELALLGNKASVISKKDFSKIIKGM
jgi:hypothetical protein